MRGSSRPPQSALWPRPACTPIRARAPDPDALFALVSQSHLTRATERFLNGYNVIERRALASSLKFGLIARGEADLYPRVGPTSEWDTAAGHAVLAAAGGTVTRLDGAPLTLRQCRARLREPRLCSMGARAAGEARGRVGAGAATGRVAMGPTHANHAIFERARTTRLRISPHSSGQAAILNDTNNRDRRKQ